MRLSGVPFARSLTLETCKRCLLSAFDDDHNDLQKTGPLGCRPFPARHCILPARYRYNRCDLYCTKASDACGDSSPPLVHADSLAAHVSCYSYQLLNVASAQDTVGYRQVQNTIFQACLLFLGLTAGAVAEIPTLRCRGFDGSDYVLDVEHSKVYDVFSAQHHKLNALCVPDPPPSTWHAVLLALERHHTFIRATIRAFEPSNTTSSR